MEAKEAIGSIKLCFSMLSVGLMLMNCVPQQSEASSMEDEASSPVMHGFSHEKPLTLSPSAAYFFSPGVLKFSPPPLQQEHQFYQERYPRSSASSSSERDGDNMSGGAKAGIALTVVLFGVGFVGGGTYVYVTRRYNLKRANAILPAGP